MAHLLRVGAMSMDVAARQAGVRWKHSNTFLRKVVNAKRLRELREETAFEPPPPPPPLKYEANVTPAFVLPHGWAPAPEAPPAHLPFQVQRTGGSGGLPVYIKYKNQGSRMLTVVRHVKGDVGEFALELQKVCHAEAVERRGNTLQVVGNHVRPVQEWLLRLGF